MAWLTPQTKLDLFGGEGFASFHIPMVCQSPLNRHRKKRRKYWTRKEKLEDFFMQVIVHTEANLCEGNACRFKSLQIVVHVATSFFATSFIILKKFYISLNSTFFVGFFPFGICPDFWRPFEVAQKRFFGIQEIKMGEVCLDDFSLFPFRLSSLWHSCWK